MNDDALKIYIEKNTNFDLSDIFDPLVERRIVWKKRSFTKNKGRLELLEIAGEKIRVSAYINYDFSTKKPEILVWKDRRLILSLDCPDDMLPVAKGLEKTSLAICADFRKYYVRHAVRGVIKMYYNLRKEQGR